MANCYGYYSQRKAASPAPRSVPTWQKRFCWEVGRVPWKRIVNSKKYVHDSHKVICWNDSAGQEAFKAAKLRFWAKINGLPCTIPLPSPDKYIDKVEWDVPNCSTSNHSNNNNNHAIDDAEAFDDLDEASRVERGREEGNIVLPNSSFEVSFHQIKPTGWDDDNVGHDRLFDRGNHPLAGMVVGE